ncbi:MAG: S-layer homology domain-containing protein, partial [Chloroflexota bacterium]
MKYLTQAARRIAVRLLGLAAVFLYTCFGGGAWASALKAGENISMHGQFFIVYGDGPDLAPQTSYFLHNGDGQVISLELTEEVAQAAGGVLSLNRQQVVAHGSVSKSPQGTARLQVGSIAAAADGPGPQAVTGPHPWITIMCKFNDMKDTPKDLAYFQNMYGSKWPGLDHYWREVSFNNVNVEGSQAVGWYILPQPRSYYIVNGKLSFGRAANDCTAVADADVNFVNFDGINLMFNAELDGYAWAAAWPLNLDGVAKLWNVTWEPPWAYSNITVLSHEMGHTFGLPHSSGTYGQVYDNRWDVMSAVWVDCANSTDPIYGCTGQHTIAFHKDLLGWIDPSERYIPPADGSTHTILLDQLSLPQTDNYKMVKIPIAASRTHFYTLETRHKVGYDVKLPGQAVIIHEVDTTRSIPAHVIDSDNNRDTGDDGAMWLPGETFQDEANGITVTILSATDTGFEISVSAPSLPPSTFYKTSPSHGANNLASDLTLSWDESVGVDNYSYCFDTSDDDDCANTWTDTGKATSVALSGLDSGTYYWQVRAANVNATVYANNDDWWQFTVNSLPTAIRLDNLTVIENLPAATRVGTLSSVDADTGETFTYSLVTGDGSDDNANFAIQENTLQTTRPLNYLTQISHTVRIRTVDSRGAGFEQAFIISVVDAPPMFADVPDSYWAAPWIERLANSGITGGCGEGNYCPDLGVTRAQMAVFLLTGIHGNDYTPP